MGIKYYRPPSVIPQCTEQIQANRPFKRGQVVHLCSMPTGATTPGGQVKANNQRDHGDQTEGPLHYKFGQTRWGQRLGAGDKKNKRCGTQKYISDSGGGKKNRSGIWGPGGPGFRQRRRAPVAADGAAEALHPLCVARRRRRAQLQDLKGAYGVPGSCCQGGPWVPPRQGRTHGESTLRRTNG